jgi:hypothetical protein
VSANKDYSFQNKKEVCGYKSSKERTTVLCCANDCGSHKPKLCVVGKAKEPCSFKGTEKTHFPVTYLSQKGAWMDFSIFKTWFGYTFVLQVREHLKLKGLVERLCCCSTLCQIFTT